MIIKDQWNCFENLDLDKYDIISFDFDGVLCDSHIIKNNVFNEIFAEYNKHEFVEAYNTKYFGQNRIDRIRGLLYLVEDYSETNETLKLEEFEVILHERLKNTKMLKGVINFINTIKCEKVLITNSGENSLKYLMNKFDLLQYFDGIYHYPVIKADKLKELKNSSPNKNILFIGDVESDKEAAIKAEVDFVQVHNIDFFKDYE